MADFVGCVASPQLSVRALDETALVDATKVEQGTILARVLQAKNIRASATQLDPPALTIEFEPDPGLVTNTVTVRF